MADKVDANLETKNMIWEYLKHGNSKSKHIFPQVPHTSLQLLNLQKVPWRWLITCGSSPVLLVSILLLTFPKYYTVMVWWPGFGF